VCVCARARGRGLLLKVRRYNVRLSKFQTAVRFLNDALRNHVRIQFAVVSIANDTFHFGDVRRCDISQVERNNKRIYRTFRLRVVPRDMNCYSSEASRADAARLLFAGRA